MTESCHQICACRLQRMHSLVAAHLPSSSALRIAHTVPMNGPSQAYLRGPSVRGAVCVVVCMGNSKSREQVRVAAEGGLISTHVIRQHWCRYVGADTMPRASALPFLEGVAKEAEISVPQSELLAIIDSCAQRTACHPLWRAGGDVIRV